MLFWRAALDDAPALAAQVASMHAPSNNEDNHERYQALRTLPDDVAPAEFFLLNRFAFSAIMNGTRSTASPQRLTRRLRNATARLRDFYAPLLSVDHAKFEDSIRLHRNDFLYLDPPYYTAGRGFYEVSREVGFNHGALAALLKARMDGSYHMMTARKFGLSMMDAGSTLLNGHTISIRAANPANC